MVNLQEQTKICGARLLVSIAVVLLSSCCALCQSLPPGTILLSKNADEALNESPGTTNHVCVVANDGSIIESQAGIGVQRISLATYRARKYSPPSAMIPCALEVGKRAAAKAESLVGLPFRKISSIFRRQGERRQKKGLNCVSVVKWSYWDEDRRVRRIKIPDHVLRLEGLFDAPRPLSEVLKAPAEPAVPPAEHSVLMP